MDRVNVIGSPQFRHDQNDPFLGVVFVFEKLEQRDGHNFPKCIGIVPSELVEDSEHLFADVCFIRLTITENFVVNSEENFINRILKTRSK